MQVTRIEKRCMFSLKYFDFKEKQFNEKLKTSQTGSTIPARNFSKSSIQGSQMNGKLEKYLESELTEVAKNREKQQETPTALPSTARTLAYVRIY